MKKKDFSELLTSISVFVIFIILVNPIAPPYAPIIAITIYTMLFVTLRRLYDYSLVRLSYTENGHPIAPAWNTLYRLKNIPFWFFILLSFNLIYPFYVSLALVAILLVAFKGAHDALFFLEKKRFQQEHPKVS